MAGLSDYAETQIMNLLLRATAFTPPAANTHRLALFTSDPTDANNASTTEVASGTWYSRALTGAWSAPAAVGNSMACSNSAPITFTAVSGQAVTITHVGIMDAASNGNLLFSAPLQSQKTLQVGDVLSFAAGSLVASLD